MNAIMTITSKGQVTLPKHLIVALKFGVVDRLVGSVENGKLVAEPAGMGILDFVGKFGKINIPKGKTVDDLIHEAVLENASKTLH